MNTNFEFLLKNKMFSPFANQAIEAEKSLIVSSATVAILSRRALELAVRWVYTNDYELALPYRDNLSSLVHEDSFQRIIEPGIFPMLKYIIKLGNFAVHTNKKVKRDEAILSLRNLFEFCKWIEYCYAPSYTDEQYDEALLEKSEEQKRRPEELQDLYERLSSKDKRLEEMRRENEELQEKMSQLRLENTTVREFKVDELTEAQTRDRYIDLDLEEAGWEIGGDCRTEFEVKGMPTKTGIGRADYVLFGKNGLPLAVIEAKKTEVDPVSGSQQAKLYADCLEKTYQQRPLIFTTNGFEIYLTDDYNDLPMRRVSGIFTKDELQLNIDRRKIRQPLNHISINDAITDRPYQKEAVTAICDAVMKKRRKMLLVQATGSGKTRVSISIVDVLTKHNYVKNILFLADRKALVKQAKNSYHNLLPELTLCNLLENKEDPEQCRMIFSTYPTMMNAIDDTKSKTGNKLFTPGHFDLIIMDESHRSIYKKYQEIFNYFDAMLIGMTATPKSDVGKNTYAIFDLENRVPTFAYELSEAVAERYLVDYNTLEYKTDIMQNGIQYDQLTEEEKEEFDEMFGDDPSIEKDINSNAINEWLFNFDTVDMVLRNLMKKGIKVEGGDKVGKTIIFAKNSMHAKIIVDRFQKMFPEYGAGYIKQIDYSISYADTLIDDFSSKDKMPQIAVSVDMLDTGIDIPEILNLVFFKRVRSYSKFWQMIGRGTRLCKNLFGQGRDKERFLIFDFCNNFDFFRINTNEAKSGIEETLSEKIFNCKVGVARALQEQKYHSDNEFCQYRVDLVDELTKDIIELNDSSFRVKSHLRYVEKYRSKAAWNQIEAIQMSEIKEHISPLIIPAKEEELARRFDHLLYSTELAILQSRNASKNIGTIIYTAEQLSVLYRIPQVKEQKYIIEKIMTDEFWEDISVLELEAIRESLRDLIINIEKKKQPVYYTNFTDEIIDMQEGEPIYNVNDLKKYRQKVEFYLKEHKDNLAVYKLRHNRKLNKTDLKELERILWGELGTKDDYVKEYGDTPIGILVRRIVGLEKGAVNEAFSEFLSEERLNVNQIRFVKLLIDYIAVNGMLDDNSVLMEEPFRSVGSITTIFKGDLNTAKQIMDVVGQIKDNAGELA